MPTSDNELVKMAEKYRAEVPKEFLQDMDSISADLASGREVIIVRTKGNRRIRGKASSQDIKAVIIDELRLLLCTKDSKYKDLRGRGNTIGKDAVHFIAGIVVASLGLASGMATGCVAFAVLACTRVGVAVFCRLNPPLAAKEKSTSR